MIVLPDKLFSQTNKKCLIESLKVKKEEYKKIIFFMT